MNRWWENTVFYEIYIMSFCDSNGDGIGDIPGIISKLPYLKRLGVGGIWLTPFYPSPKVDNGYDVSDYYAVDSAYGTMEDFENMIKLSHELGIKIIIDMVVNHTSTQHPWFLEAASSRESLKRDWYIWKDSAEGDVPNNWESFFGGSAWELDRNTGQYYYHSFAGEQADLNWQNSQVEEAVGQVLDFWIQKGVDGFRFDVINNLSVSAGLEDNPVEEDGRQIHVNDVNQPGIHQKIAAICSRIRKKNPDVFLVGEISSDELERIHSHITMSSLDTTFNFNLGSREAFRPGEVVEEMKYMQMLYRSHENPTLFFGSHDMGRFPDRFSFSEGKVKCLLALMLISKGIPFLYYGDELGMRNRVLADVDDAEDIQGIMAYQAALTEGKTIEEAIRILNEKSRDASRNHMDWTEAANQKLPCSIWDFTRSLIGIRNNTGLAAGGMRIRESEPEVIEIVRILKNKRIRAVLNYSDKAIAIPTGQNSSLLLTSERNLKCMEGSGWKLPAEACLILEENLEKNDDNTEIG